MSDPRDISMNRPAPSDVPHLRLYQVDLARVAPSHAARAAWRDPVDARGGPPPLDPAALLVLSPPGAPRFFWAAADEDFAIAGFGAAHRVTAEGAERLAIVAQACAEVRARMEREEPASEGLGSPEAGDAPGPVWLGGFAFEDRAPGAGLWSGFPAAAFTLPEVALVRRDGQVWLIVAGPAGAPQDLRQRADAIVDALAGSAGRALSAGAADAQAEPDHAAVDPFGPGRGDADGGGTIMGFPIDATQAGATQADVTQADTDQAIPDLRERIARTIAAIRRGEAEKVVLATSRTVHVSRLDPLTVLARLRAKQPGCFHFLCTPGSPGSAGPAPAFLGASPERLVRIAGDRLATVALAGSARRDADPAVDRALGEALLASAKDRAEHALVVEAIQRNLGRYALDLPPEPRLRQLATLQHLETPIAAHLPGQGDVLGEAARLHPTPALGGTPRDAALALIRTHEGLDRGWYGGGIGWIDGRGNGELAVAIRALLVAPAAATAFAGAGLVAASEPEAELREIGLKLASVLTASVLSPIEAEVLNPAPP